MLKGNRRTLATTGLVGGSLRNSPKSIIGKDGSEVVLE